MLTFELNNNNDRVEIHGDKKGLLKLANILFDMANQNESEHRHLMTASWGGDELNSDRQGLNNKLLNHVKILFWDKKD